MLSGLGDAIGFSRLTVSPRFWGSFGQCLKLDKQKLVTNLYRRQKRQIRTGTTLDGTASQGIENW